MMIGVVGDPLYVAAGRMRVEHEAGCAVPVLGEKVHDELAIAAVENVVSALQDRSGRRILVERGRRALHDPAVLSALAVDDQERVDRP